MERNDLSDVQYKNLLDSIFPIIKENGPSHTTMDLVASRLAISKRTLYEIFGSKDAMLLEVFEYHHRMLKNKFEQIFSRTSNVMEGIARVIAFHQKIFSEVNPAFFSDMDTRLKHLRPDFEETNKKFNSDLSKVIELGVKQGVFRDDIDYTLQFTLLRVQMESLKRMEEYFPPDITLGQAYKAISQGFLRTIASNKGLEILDNIEKSGKLPTLDDEQPPS